VNRASFALLASLVVASVFARSQAPEVTFLSPCECQLPRQKSVGYQDRSIACSLR
jgi:hypothetical protein